MSHHKENPALPQEPVPFPETTDPKLPDFPIPQPDSPVPGGPAPQRTTPPYNPTAPEAPVPQPVLDPP